MKRLSAILFSLLAALAFGKDKPTVTIQIVDSQASTRELSYTTPGRPGRSNTTCNTTGTADTSGNATSDGDNTSYSGSTNLNADTNCTTTSTPPTPPQTHTRYITQENVHAIMPDGSHVALWCQAQWRRCDNLRPGSYTAEIDGGSVRIYAPDLSQKVHKIKYKDVGGW